MQAESHEDENVNSSSPRDWKTYYGQFAREIGEDSVRQFFAAASYALGAGLIALMLAIMERQHES